MVGFPEARVHTPPFLVEARNEWAKTTSANEDVNIYIGALAGNDGVGYVNADMLAGYIRQAQESCRDAAMQSEQGRTQAQAEAMGGTKSGCPGNLRS